MVAFLMYIALDQSGETAFDPRQAPPKARLAAPTSSGAGTGAPSREALDDGAVPGTPRARPPYTPS